MLLYGAICGTDIDPDVTIHQFKAGPPVFPNGGRGSLHVSEIDFILICKKLTKNQIGPPAFPNGGRGQPIFVVSILPCNHFAEFGESGVNADLKLNEGYRLTHTILWLKQNFWNVST